MKVLGIIIGLFFAMVACGAIVGSGSTPATSTPTQTARTQSAAIAATPVAPVGPPIMLNLSDIGRDYHNNKVNAQNKWDGQYVQFTAPVRNISDALGGSVSFDMPPDMFSQLVCYVSDEQQLARPNLANGAKATVRGTIDGDQTMGVVAIRGCEIIG